MVVCGWNFFRLCAFEFGVAPNARRQSKWHDNHQTIRGDFSETDWNERLQFGGRKKSLFIQRL